MKIYEYLLLILNLQGKSKFHVGSTRFSSMHTKNRSLNGSLVSSRDKHVRSIVMQWGHQRKL